MALQANVMEVQAKVMVMQVKVMEMQEEVMEVQVNKKKRKSKRLNTTSSFSSQPPAARRVGHLAWSRHTIRMRKASQGPAQHNSQGYLADLNNARLEQLAKATTMLTRKSQKYMQQK